MDVLQPFFLGPGSTPALLGVINQQPFFQPSPAVPASDLEPPGVLERRPDTHPAHRGAVVNQRSHKL